MIGFTGWALTMLTTMTMMVKHKKHDAYLRHSVTLAALSLCYISMQGDHFQALGNSPVFPRHTAALLPTLQLLIYSLFQRAIIQCKKPKMHIRNTTLLIHYQTLTLPPYGVNNTYFSLAKISSDNFSNWLMFPRQL